MIAGQYKETSGVVYDNYAQRIKDENSGTIPGGAESKLVVTARRVFEGRVDGAARANAAERVAIDTAPLLGLDPEETYQAQMYPLTKFNGVRSAASTSTSTAWCTSACTLTSCRTCATSA
jgi:hypothetical protein